MSARRKHAYTMLELVVTICIILVLISILIPTIGGARRRSKITVCASNLRQIGQALHSYRSEMRRWPDAWPIPAPFIYPGEPGGPWSLPDVMSSYLSPRSGVYRCPGDFEVFEQCASQPGGFGISYFYWTPYAFPKQHTEMLSDFQGYSGPVRTVNVSQFHPPQSGINALQIDGSVDFGLANPDGR